MSAGTYFFLPKIAGIKFSCYLCPRNGGLAQLARALAWHARGHEFESRILHQETTQKIANPCKSRIYRDFYFGRNAKKLREAGYPQSVRIFLKKPTILAPVQFKKNPRIACDTRDQ